MSRPCRPSVIPNGSWPRRMPASLAAGYCGESTVDAFLKRVGKEYPLASLTRYQLYLIDNLDQTMIAVFSTLQSREIRSRSVEVASH